MKINFGFAFIGSLIFVTSCYTSQKSNISPVVSNSENKDVYDDLTLVQNDTTLFNGLYDASGDGYDGSGDGVFGRKIIYRDLSATKAAVNVSGKITIKVCINRDGIVTYTEILGDETTIGDKTILRKYLKAAKGYKFQRDLYAPKSQCGKLKFTIDNTASKIK